MTIDNKMTINPVTLFQEHLKLTGYFVHKQFPNVSYGSFLYEELLGEARIALWKAATIYNHEKSKFITYASICIRGCILTYYSRVHKKQIIAFGNSLDFSPGEYNCCIGDLLASDIDTESVALGNITKKAVKEAVKEKYQILDLYFFQGLSQLTISKKLRKSKDTVSREIKDELIKIEKELKLA